MGAMYKLKAYFGMVPADELEAYADDPVQDRYPVARRVERGSRDFGDDRWDDRYAGAESEPYDDGRDRRPSRAVDAPRPVSVGSRGGSGFGPPATHGALAFDTDPFHREHAIREPARPPVVAAVADQRDRALGGAAALSRIITLQPSSYHEARTIGERYRDGIPVIINLTELDEAAARRLVDFAAGLAFALRGSIDKVTNRVFLLTPADVDVSADDARKIAQRSVGGARADAERGTVRGD